MTPSHKNKDDIITYREMCDIENVQTLQRGMNYRMNGGHTVVLMSQRNNAPYNDTISDDGITIYYEGHDVTKSDSRLPKLEDQPISTKSGKPTQNGLFIKAVEDYKKGLREPEVVRIYEKLMPGIWSMKGFFNLIDYKEESDGNRKVFKFEMKLADKKSKYNSTTTIEHTRIIPSDVKRAVFIRDKGRCVICNSNENLHFDHDLPFSKGGSSLTEKNIRILCMKHNLEKSAKIQ